MKDRGSSAAELPVKFQSDAIIITSNLAASRLRGGGKSYPSVNTGPVSCDIISLADMMKTTHFIFRMLSA